MARKGKEKFNINLKLKYINRRLSAIKEKEGIKLLFPVLGKGINNTFQCTGKT